MMPRTLPLRRSLRALSRRTVPALAILALLKACSVAPVPGLAGLARTRAGVPNARVQIQSCQDAFATLELSGFSSPAFEDALAAAPDCDPDNPRPVRTAGSTPDLQSPDLTAPNAGANAGSSLLTGAAGLILVGITRGRDACQLLPEAYRVGCLGVVLRGVAEDLPQGEDFVAVRSVLQVATADLDGILQQNLDTAAAPRQVTGAGKPLPPVRAVTRQSQARAAALAEQVIAEAATTLLRSSGTAAQRRLPYQQIAAAIDSTKVLFRSG